MNKPPMINKAKIAKIKSLMDVWREAWRSEGIPKVEGLVTLIKTDWRLGVTARDAFEYDLPTFAERLLMADTMQKRINKVDQLFTALGSQGLEMPSMARIAYAQEKGLVLPDGYGSFDVSSMSYQLRSDARQCPIPNCVLYRSSVLMSMRVMYGHDLIKRYRQSTQALAMLCDATDLAHPVAVQIGGVI